MRTYRLGLTGVLFAIWSALVFGQAVVETSPLAVGFAAASGLPRLQGAATSAFYIAHGTSRTAIATVLGHTVDGERHALTCVAADGRAASIVLEPGPRGSTRIAFSVAGKGEFDKLGITLHVSASEGFYGLMERVVQGSQGFSWQPGMTAGLNLRGQTVDLYTLPTVSIYAPFFLSSAGWGAYVEGSWPGTYRFGVTADREVRAELVEIETEDLVMSLLLLPGPRPEDVIERYAALSGYALLPPRFLLGPGRWRDECFDLGEFYDGTPYGGPFNSMVVEDVLMMDALDIPCSWVVVDRPWAAGTFGYGGLSFDEARYPDFAEMVEWLAGRGIGTLLWIGPWVMDGERETALREGYSVERTLPYLPEAALLDFTNAEAVTWWQDLLRPLIETGIAGFKLDRGEEKPPDGQVFRGAYDDGTDYREGHNAFPLWFARAAFDAGQLHAAGEFVSIYRAGWTGISQWTASWGGDTDPSEWGLRSAIIALQRAAILNAPIWGSDTGGYNKRPPREVLARWLAFSACCPIMEVGPTANLAPWSWLPDASADAMGASGYTFPTVYDAELAAIWSLYANLHRDLGDYLYAAAERAHGRGTPIVRPMIVAYPEDVRFIDTFEQYMLGPDLLVRPVWERGVEQVDILLPVGTWIDAWTGKRYVGPGKVPAVALLHQIPLFLRDGSALELGDLDARWQAAWARAVAEPDIEALAVGVRQ